MNEITQNNFEDEVLNSDLPVVVDFWAEWCGPCKVMLPVIESLSEEYEGKVKFVKVNVDDEQELATSMNVRGIPTFTIFKDGEVLDSVSGAIPKGKFVEFVSRSL